MDNLAERRRTAIVRSLALLTIALLVAVSLVAGYIAYNLQDSSSTGKLLPLSPPLFVRNPNDIFGNFSELSFHIYIQGPSNVSRTTGVISGGQSNFTARIIRTTTAVINGSTQEVRIINITQTNYYLNSSFANYSSALVYLPQSGEPINATTSLGQSLLFRFDAGFNFSCVWFWQTLGNSTLMSKKMLTYDGNYTRNFSNSFHLVVLNYTGSNIAVDSQVKIAAIDIDAGNVSGSDFSLTSYLSMQLIFD